jgi:Mitotic checkpoint protein
MQRPPTMKDQGNDIVASSDERQELLRPNKKRAAGLMSNSEEEATVVRSRGSLALSLATASTSNATRITQLLLLERQVASLQSELDHSREIRLLEQESYQQEKSRMTQRVEWAMSDAEETRTLLNKERLHNSTINQELRKSRDDALSQLSQLQLELDQAQASGRRRSHRQPMSRDDENSSTTTEEFRSDEDEHVRPFAGEDDEPLETVRYWQQRCRVAEQSVQGLSAETGELRKELSRVQNELKAELLVIKEQQQKEIADSSGSTALKMVEEATPAVLRELNRVRIELADTSRTLRQSERKCLDLETRYQAAVQQNEADRRDAQRLQRLQQEYATLSTEHTKSQALQQTWQEFQQSLLQFLMTDQSFADGQGDYSFPRFQLAAAETERNTAGGASSLPPDISRVVRYLNQVRDYTLSQQQIAQQIRSRFEELQKTVLPLEQRVMDQQSSVRKAQQDLVNAIKERDESKSHAALLKAKESILQREADNLRSLIQTYDNLPLVPNTAVMPESGKSAFDSSLPVFGSPAFDKSGAAVEIKVKSLQEELTLLTKDRDRLQEELEVASAQLRDKSSELDRVKDKYGKLRQALEESKAAAAQAEQRAARAEELSGRGAFDPEKTRVLHLNSPNAPLSEALREEILVLRRQLATAKDALAETEKSSVAATLTATPGTRTPGVPKSVSSGKVASVAHSVDPEILNQRLKASFKEQISLFREGVYLMTGFKVDMLPGCDRPTFRVRSVFAEREEDQLLLKWPKKKKKSSSRSRAASGGTPQADQDGEHDDEEEAVRSLDILDTDFAKIVATTPSYQFVSQYHSLPAFLASIQLSLFEKQTQM